MTLLMIAGTAIHNSSPMLGEYPGTPAWKMKDDDSDEEESHFGGDDHRESDSYVLDQLLAPFVDIDVAEMADYLDIERCELGLIGDDASWPEDDVHELNSYGYLTDTVLDFQRSTREDDGPTEIPHSTYTIIADHMYSAVSEDHMYSLSSRASSTETVSRAASTSGYSSGTESLVSNEDAPVGVLSPSPTSTSLLTQSATSLLTKSATSLLTPSATSLLTQSATSLLTQSATSILTQSATSLLRQQAKSLLKPKAVVPVEEAVNADDESARRESRKRTRSRVKAVSGNKKWSRMGEEEQKESITELTDIISSQLGVRERLEAIRIINPHSAVSPTDGEFVIDMKPINDTRFNKLQKFVRLHADDLSVTSTSACEQRTSPQLEAFA
ncbi:uncharacterized protein [Littorina saxatilis]|uniref:uncharacterized protein n=1 Tax=Littorina saxatilis TaxID=31220 RepID=UPI0038B4BAD5